MKTRSHNLGRPSAGRAETLSWRLWLGLVVIAFLTSSCAFNTARPSAADLRSEDGRNRAVVLIRVVTEIDGKDSPAFPSSISEDSIWLGLGDFSTGGKIRPAAQLFLSADTRRNGWTYLLLEPGIYYLAPHVFQNDNAFAYDASWEATPPRWRLEVPSQPAVIYAGTLFVPGAGRWMLFRGRRMYQFEPQHFQVRDESTLAATIQQAWLKDLGPISTQLVHPHSSYEPIILETPPGR